jgi:hypothetical protein
MNKPRRWTWVRGLVVLLVGARMSTFRLGYMRLRRRALQIGRRRPLTGALSHAPMA